jgi:hypothetical protein
MKNPAPTGIGGVKHRFEDGHAIVYQALALVKAPAYDFDRCAARQ